jgi:hypothetical protein
MWEQQLKRLKDVSTDCHASSCIITSRPAQQNTKSSNQLSRIEREDLIKEFNVGVFFKHDLDLADVEINLGTENKASYTMYIAEDRLQDCPRITIKIGEEKVSAILDTGCELTLMNGNLCDIIKQRGNKYIELPADLTLLSAFIDESRRVRKQTMLRVKLGNVTIGHVFLVSPQLLTLAVFGVDFFL